MEAEWSPFPKIKKWGTQKGFCAQESHSALLGYSWWSYERIEVFYLCHNWQGPLSYLTPIMLCEILENIIGE